MAFGILHGFPENRAIADRLKERGRAPAWGSRIISSVTRSSYRPGERDCFLPITPQVFSASPCEFIGGICFVSANVAMAGGSTFTITLILWIRNAPYCRSVIYKTVPSVAAFGAWKELRF